LAYFIFPTGKKEDVLDLVDYAADLHSSPRDDSTERILVGRTALMAFAPAAGIGKDIAIGFAPSRPDGSGSLLPLILSSAKRVSFDTAT
jgi:hypothetical protein